MCHLGTNAVQTINRGIADVSRLAKSTNPNATPAPKVTDMVSVHDLKAQSHHELYIYRLDYRPRSAQSVGNVVAFSKPRFAACRTEKLKLGTPAHYRDEKKHKPGIGGSVLDARRWNTAGSAMEQLRPATPKRRPGHQNPGTGVRQTCRSEKGAGDSGTGAGPEANIVPAQARANHSLPVQAQRMTVARNTRKARPRSPRNSRPGSGANLTGTRAIREAKPP